ncbi:hypothetical protein [Aureimonas sp. N4]|uniref:hypothetical protein n=1 Tax=Aureimonas sp. N4 TaxID=1638165 RepID=UPI000B00E242|nr:hypothetical protein [Aureimonas sp. N4]
MTDMRKQIMAEMTKVAAEAIARGENGLQAVQSAFPGVPLIVAVEAEMDADNAKTEAWWQTIERTIDGELVRRGIASAAEEDERC